MGVFDPAAAIERCLVLLAEGWRKDDIRDELGLSVGNFTPVYNQAKAIREAVDDYIPTAVRKEWVRSKLNRIVQDNWEENPKVAVSALAQISKDPDMNLVSRTSGIMLDEAVLAKLKSLAALDLIETKGEPIP
jgi:uncharacterized protein (UPF0147 family)